MNTDVVADLEEFLVLYHILLSPVILQVVEGCGVELTTIGYVAGDRERPRDAGSDDWPQIPADL